MHTRSCPSCHCRGDGVAATECTACASARNTSRAGASVLASALALVAVLSSAMCLPLLHPIHQPTPDPIIAAPCASCQRHDGASAAECPDCASVRNTPRALAPGSLALAIALPVTLSSATRPYPLPTDPQHQSPTPVIMHPCGTGEHAPAPAPCNSSLLCPCREATMSHPQPPSSEDLRSWHLPSCGRSSGRRDGAPLRPLGLCRRPTRRCMTTPRQTNTPQQTLQYRQSPEPTRLSTSAPVASTNLPTAIRKQTTQYRLSPEPTRLSTSAPVASTNSPTAIRRSPSEPHHSPPTTAALSGQISSTDALQQFLLCACREAIMSHPLSTSSEVLRSWSSGCVRSSGLRGSAPLRPLVIAAVVSMCPTLVRVRALLSL